MNNTLVGPFTEDEESIIRVLTCGGGVTPISLDDLYLHLTKEDPTASLIILKRFSRMTSSLINTILDGVIAQGVPFSKMELYLLINRLRIRFGNNLK